MDQSLTGASTHRGLRAAAILFLVGALSSTSSAEIFTNVLDPRSPSFAEKTELDDTIVAVVNAARGDPPQHRRRIRRTSAPIPCDAKKKGARGAVARLVRDKSVSVCVEYGGGMLRLRSRAAGTSNLVEWIPVRLSSMPRSTIEQARMVHLDGSPLLAFDLVERSGADEGRVEDVSLVLVDPIRERFLVNVMRSHTAEGNRDGSNFSESCEGVARIGGNQVQLGGYACHEEAESESPDGEIRSYTRSSGPDPEFSYRYRNGFLHQAR